MSRGSRRRFRLPTGIAGLVLAMLALVGQLAVGAIVPPDEPAEATVVELGVICHAAGPDDADRGTPHHRHSQDCAICPLCVAMAMPSVALLAPGPLLPTPVAELVAPASPSPPARGPPSRFLRTAQPRGPPVLT